MDELIGPCVDHGRKGNEDGYTKARHEGTTTNLHRVIYAKHHNLSLLELKGIVIRHRCDNSRCINPDHLEPGTVADNNRDRAERGRSQRGSKHWQAALTEEKVAVIRSEYRYRDRDHSIRALARKYGVSYSTIQEIVTGIRWRHV